MSNTLSAIVLYTGAKILCPHCKTNVGRWSEVDGFVEMNSEIYRHRGRRHVNCGSCHKVVTLRDDGQMLRG